MAIADLSGSTSNAINASQMRGAVNAGNKANLMSGLSKFGKGMTDAAAQTMIREHLKEIGLDPMLASDPKAAFDAILNKHEEDLKLQQSDKGIAGANAAFPDDVQLPTGTGMDPTDAYTIARQQAATNAAKRQRAALASAWQPTTSMERSPVDLLPGMPTSPALGTGAMVTKTPSPQEGLRTAIAGGADPAQAQEVAKSFAELTPKPVAPQPYKPMTRQEQIDFEREKSGAGRAPEKTPEQIKAAAKAEAEGRREGAPPAPERIDPLSEKGIAAQLDLAEKKARLTPGKNWDGAKSSAAALMKSDIISMTGQLHDIVKYGETDLSDEEKAQASDLRTKIAKLRARHAKLTGYSGEEDQPTKAAIDPALKKEFDGFPAERQKALLDQMTDEEKAKVGR